MPADDPGRPHDAIAGLAGVMLFTSPERFDAMRRFYVDQLGLTPDSDRPGHLACSWGAPPARIRLILATHDAVDGPNPDPHRIMVNLLVQDCRAVARRLAAAGVAFVAGPSQQSWGGWIATFRDPDGNTLQILQPA